MDLPKLIEISYDDNDMELEMLKLSIRDGKLTPDAHAWKSDSDAFWQGYGLMEEMIQKGVKVGFTLECDQSSDDENENYDDISVFFGDSISDLLKKGGWVLDEEHGCWDPQEGWDPYKGT